MRINKFPIFISVAILLFVVSPALYAKEAVPMAADPEMEKLVNEISEELRCLVCQNQTIADSHADLAVDLKNQVRQMVSEGKSEDEIVNYMVQRYGDFVRYRPPIKSSTIFLWIGPFILLVAGVVLLIINLKKRKRVIADAPLSEEESDKLSSLLKAEASAAGKSTGGEAN